MVKKFNERTMTFKDNNGEEHRVFLYTTKTRNYTTEHAYCSAKDVEGKYKWCNRPWERFDYEEAMKAMIAKLPKEWRENATRRLINDEDERITKECDEFLNAFESNYDKLSDKTKQSLAEHAPMIETEEQAKFAGTAIAMMAALGL